jgi:hypothetical protein
VGEPARGFWGLEWLRLDRETISLVLRLLFVGQRSEAVKENNFLAKARSSQRKTCWFSWRALRLGERQ